MKRKKIVFVSGFLGGKHDMIFFEKDKRFEIYYFRYNTYLIQNLEEIGKELNDFILSLDLKKNEKIGFVGHSAGGVIIDYFLKKFGFKNCDVFVSLCSPFKGSFFGNFFPFLKGVWMLRRGSDFLKKWRVKKNNKSLKRLSLWCPLDIMVLGTSGKGEGAEKTWFLLHWFIQYYKPIVRRCCDFLAEKK